MRKMKERIKIMLEKLREEELHFETTEADKKRLEKLLEKVKCCDLAFLGM